MPKNQPGRIGSESDFIKNFCAHFIKKTFFHVKNGTGLCVFKIFGDFA